MLGSKIYWIIAYKKNIKGRTLYWLIKINLNILYYKDTKLMQDHFRTLKKNIHMQCYKIQMIFNCITKTILKSYIKDYNHVKWKSFKLVKIYF